jgi:hypothetical protein
MKNETILLTPEIAAKLLESNKMNRKLRDYWVAYLAGEMAAGRWHINGVPIIVDEDGELVDGQHRCEAAILADYSFEVNLVTDVDPKTRLTIDDPMRRTFADDLVMNDHGPNANVKEALLRRILTWNKNHGFAAAKERVSRATLAEYFPLYSDQIDRAIRVTHKHYRQPLGNNVGAFMAWLLLEAADEKTVDYFFSVLSIGSQKPEDYMLVRLHDRIQALKAEVSFGWRGAGRSPYMIWLCITAWNAWITGKSNQILGFPRGRILTDPFPQPVVAMRVGEVIPEDQSRRALASNAAYGKGKK